MIINILLGNESILMKLKYMVSIKNSVVYCLPFNLLQLSETES